MNERNPYENQESVEIPDFKSIKDEDDIDRSKFKLGEEEFDEEEFYDEEPKYRNVKQSVVIVAIILLVLFLGLSIFGIAFGLSKNKAYNTLNEEYQAYKTKAIDNETALNAKIVELQTQITEKEKEEEAKTVSDSYKIVVDSLYVRNDAKSDGSNFADYASLSSDVKELCAQDGSATIVFKGSVFNVTETKKNGNATWGKIDTNAWICLNDGTTEFCSKQ